tara:strand:- start:167 stop:319 length:153 start_codon:yes stop_codon:yes gene_type:complete
MKIQKFIKVARSMDTDLLLLDKFMHDGFYQEEDTLEGNLEALELFLKNYR